MSEQQAPQQAQDPVPDVPAQRGPRDEAIRAARKDYAEHARDGDLEALLAPYHRP